MSAMAIIMLSAMFFGALFGRFLPDLAQSLAPVTTWYVAALRSLATPLLFFLIMGAVTDFHLRWKDVRRFTLVCVINTVAAMAIGLILVNSWPVGRELTHLFQGVTAADTMKIPDVHQLLKNLVPQNLFEPFLQNNALGVVLIALLFGFACRALQKHQDSQVKKGLQVAHDLMVFATQFFLLLLHWSLYLSPFVVFIAVGKAVANHGFESLASLMLYVIICLTGMILQIVLVYQSWIVLTRKVTLKDFWRAAKTPALFAFGVNSSLATIGETMEALRRLGVSQRAARLGACIGTNFNNDGILLYQVVAVLLIGQALGLEIPLSQQIAMALFSVIATLGVSGVPEAGVVALTILLGVLHIPAEPVALLLGVDWVVARMRSTTNALADITVSIAIDDESKPGHHAA